jgi:cell division protein FtsL
MNRRRPRQVKSKVYNYQVADRHRHPGSGRWIHVMIALALIAVATGIAYVWQHNQLVRTGYTIGKLRNEIVALDEQRTRLEVDVRELKEPNRIRRLVHERGLGLGPASSDQIVRLPDPEALTVAPDDEARPALGRRLWDAIVLGER